MRRPFLLVLFVSGLLPAAAARAQVVHEAESESHQGGTTATKGEKGPDLAAVAKGIVDRTNAFRKEEGRPAVAVNEKLTATAQYFADFMARTDKYGHTADGNRPDERAKRHGYDYCMVAENIAYVYNSAGFTAGELAEKFFTGWKESPGHRRNMLDPDVTETGVAVARSEKTGYYYAVQMFGRPKSAAIEFSVANQSPDEISYEIGGKTFTLPPRYTRTHSRCRPADLKAVWPGGQEPAVVRPARGDKFAVVKEAGKYQLKKE
ncbi:MAG: hypothetical protein JWO38_6029 [Gemmataceae bacterium]|nr:hypothetical protein [Gemmataceae bacterium]